MVCGRFLTSVSAARRGFGSPGRSSSDTIGVARFRLAPTSSLIRGTPCTIATLSEPEKWNELSVICESGSPIEVAVSAPIPSPGCIRAARTSCSARCATATAHSAEPVVLRQPRGAELGPEVELEVRVRTHRAAELVDAAPQRRRRRRDRAGLAQPHRARRCGASSAMSIGR